MLALGLSAAADEAAVLVIARRFELDTSLENVFCYLVCSTDVENVVFRHLASVTESALAIRCTSDEVSKMVFYDR